jgi:hypothetical protein
MDEIYEGLKTFMRVNRLGPVPDKQAALGEENLPKNRVPMFRGLSNAVVESCVQLSEPHKTAVLFLVNILSSCGPR